MDWLDRTNRAMDYIETHLTEEIDYNQVAKMAFCSTYHFQRMFSFITGVSLSEYIRRRRLTLAALELQNGDCKVIDVAIKYGYESTEAFTRAFKSLHGVVPSAARKKGTALKAYPRMSFHISIKGDVEMKYRIEERPAFIVFGKSRRFKEEEGWGKGAQELWREIMSNGILDKIVATKQNQEDCTLGIIYHGGSGKVYMGNDSTINYFIGIEKKDNMDTTGFDEIVIPPATWAVFSTKEYDYDSGLLNKYLDEIYKKIYSEWFPTSGYEHNDDIPVEMEFYMLGSEYDEYIDLWMPIIKKVIVD